MDARCRITLFKNLTVQQGDRILTKFRDKPTAALLAYLTLYPDKKHERLLLAEEIWPDTDAESRRNSLNTAVSSLRDQLEPPGIPRGTILDSTRAHIRFNPDVVTSDAIEFDRLLQEAANAQNNPVQQAGLFQKANALYTGPLLQDFYDEWIILKQSAKAEDHARLFVGWVKALYRSGSIDEAMAVLQNAVRAYPDRKDIETLAEQLGRLPKLHVGVNSLPTAPPPTNAEESDKEAVTSVPVNQETRPPYTETLPLRPTRFIGREARIEQLAERLRKPDTRLVTITGMGGVGKTRLAIETARRLAPNWNERVWFVALEKVSSPASIPPALIRALGLSGETGEGGKATLERAIEFLREAPSLLILDNFEHLLCSNPGDSEDAASEDTGEGVVASLLLRVPDLTCLLTSRQALSLEGEQEVPLEPMPVPEGNNDPTVLMQCESVALFIDRAQERKPDFAIKPNNAADIAELCRCLEGLPLSLEMAAVWAKTLTPATMVTNWKGRLNALNNRVRNTSKHHKSLWAAIAVSYHLLPNDDLRQFLASLSVFDGGWKLEAAQALCQHAEDYLADLSDRSLILAEENQDGSAMRYRLLESTRQFAAEQLALTPKQKAETGRLHRDFFLAMVEEACSHRDASRRAFYMNRFETEYRNLIQAIHFCLEDPAGVEPALWLTGVLQRFWASHGHLADGRELLAKALLREGADKPTQARAVALNSAGVLAAMQADYAAAYAYLEECVIVSRRLEDDKRLLDAHGNIGVLAFQQRDYDRAIAQFEQVLCRQEESEDQEGAAMTLHNLADVYTRKGDYPKAGFCFAQSLARRRDFPDEEKLAILLNDFAEFWREQEKYAEARECLAECLSLFQKLHHIRGIAHALDGFADLAYLQGQPEQAVTLFIAAKNLRVVSQAALSVCDQQNIDHSLAELERVLESEPYKAAKAKGNSLNSDQAVAEALASGEICMEC